MVKTAKDQARQLASELQQSTMPEAYKIKQMIDLLFENVKHNLVNAEGDNFLRLQGEARLLQRLREQLTVKRVELPQRGQE